MSIAQELLNDYKRIRDRLRHPPNAVIDYGINLRRHRIPTAPPIQKISVYNQDSGAVFCRVNIVQVIPLPTPKIGLALHAIERAVCQYFRITQTILYSKRRTKEVVYPRHIFWYLACQHTVLSLPMIGRKANCDHTTILHAREKITQMILVDSRTAGIVKQLEDMLFTTNEPKSDQPKSPVAAVTELNLAEKQTISLPKLEIYTVD